MAVTSPKVRFSCIAFFASLMMLPAQSALAAVLPEERADALYHYFEGGGVDIQGPSILVRKSIKDKVSVSANYYVDNVSSASIDVVTTASAYTEQRIESSVGVDYLHDKTILSLNYTQSDENDYSARSAHFGVSQDFFGDLTTLSLGYSQGWDTVGKRGEPEFSEDTNRRNFRIGLTQVITKNTLLGFSWETITDQGFLNNPYRSVRYLDPSVGAGYSYQEEFYPATRTSDAFAIRGIYYLPYRASLKMEFRQFSDTWGIEANTIEAVYVHPLASDWVFDVKLRRYQQDKADFFSDLFPRIDAQNFRARDKEMSTFTTSSIGLGASYEQPLKGWRYFDKYSVNLSVDYIEFDFEDFRDLRVSAVAGSEPLYQFDANVFRFYLSLFY